MQVRNFILASIALTTPGLLIAAADDEKAQLRQDIQELKQHYEARIQELEARLARLEQAETQANLPIPERQPQAAVEDNGTDLKNTFANTTESRSMAMQYEDTLFSERVSQVLQDFVEIGGYFRAGYGRNDQGGSQVGFKAPGAGAKYRLGNEPENFGEIIFAKNFFLPGRFGTDPSTRPVDGPIARVQVRIDIFNPHDSFSSGSDTTFGFPEAWVSFGNVIEGQADAKFWAGNRFYRRHDIHIIDYFLWNMSGGGGGIEDITLGNSIKLAMAWIGWGSRSGFSDLPEPDPNNEAGFSKTNFDVRLYEIPFLAGEVELGLVYSRVKSGLDADGNQAPDTEGFAINFVHTMNGFISEDGANKFTIQYGTEAAKTFTSGFETFNTASGTFIRPDLEDSSRLRVTENFTANISEHFSIGPAFVYQYTDYGTGFGSNEWFSVGVRPIYHFNEKVSIAFEGGVDWVDDEDLGVSDKLYKVTIAPQISIGNRFNSRPVIRAYATWANWGDDFMGLVGGNDYATETSGFNFGVQMETWW